MAGFTRRYTYNPGTDVIQQIEGVDIIDLPAPGTLQSSGEGTACIVGEFSDMTYATAVDGTGSVTTFVQPQEVFSSADLVAKFGGFDETIGDFGISGGNGYADIRGKAYSRLIVAPVNLASAKACRFVRELPLNTSATLPIPGVPVVAASVPAGKEFRNGGGRLRIAQALRFTAQAPIATGIGGTTSSGVSAATQVFNATGGFDWTTVVRPDGTVGTYKGDILVIGYNTAGARTPTQEAGTYRVASNPVSGAAITIQRLDGANFAFTAQSTVSWRLHYATDADSANILVNGVQTPGGYAFTDAGGYDVPVRPITNLTGGNTDGTWTAGVLLTPQNAVAAATGSTWDPLSALAGIIHTSGLSFTAALQGINTASSATTDAAYQLAFDATIDDKSPMSDINIIWSSRTSSTLRSYAQANADSAAGRQAGRMAIINPELTVQVLNTVIGAASPGVGAVRAERTIYTWPGAQTFILEANNFRIRTADGNSNTIGTVDLPASSWLASIMSILPPERNPGQSADPVGKIMSSVSAYQTGTPKLGLNEYLAIKSQGICALRHDKDEGFLFQSGITTSLTSGQTNINRRRMADFIEDNQAAILQKWSKLPQTTANKDAALGEVAAFLEDLLSPNNPAAQRINAYSVDDKSGNTPALAAANIWVLISKVQLTPLMNFIVVQSEVGEGVVISNTTT